MELEKGERTQRKAEKKRGRTMDTSFVVSAAFCAPVVTESQNDMAVFVAIAVWTEMVAFLVVSKTREQGHARCFLTTRRAYLSTRPFFALEKKRKKCAFERNEYQNTCGSRRRRSKVHSASAAR